MGCCASNDAIPGYQQHNNQPQSQVVYFPSSPTYPSPTPVTNTMGMNITPSMPSGMKVKPNFNHPLFQGDLGEASKLFYFQQYAEAAEIYRNYIESLGEETVEEIDGFGQTELSLGYYQWFLFRFYKEGIEKKKHIGTVYDALSLCYKALKDDQGQIQKGIRWYMDMLDEYPENIGILIGYANILNNKGVFQEAIDYYQRVLDLKTSWMRPLECMAYIYEYKRIEKKKSCEIANKILQFEPKNRVALFVLARNGKNADDKINQLKVVMQEHPKYARCVNEIGIVYGGTKKDYRQAITWYQKAIEITPEYASCYNNIGVNFELLKDYDEAIPWYFKGIEKDKEYKAPHKNLSDIFDQQQASDDIIKAHMQKYNIQHDYFYYYMGLSYHDKKKYQEAIRYYTKAYECADELKKHIYKIHNSIGITYDDLRQDDNALKYYMKCIGANHKYHSAYYNMAIVFKRQKKIDDAIHWYKKAIEANPRYSYAYNNLGNIYKDRKQYEDAIKCYKNAVKHLSTYTLALVNMGVCYLNIENYREAFNSFERAKECLPHDNNNLSQANKDFMNGKITVFDKQGQSWRQNGCITKEQRQKLKSLISNFESNLSSKIGNQGRQPMSIQKVLKKEVLQIVRLIHQDQFSLKSIQQIYDLIKDIYEDNEEYFHILPQLYIQYFCINVFQNNRPILEVEQELYKITQRLSDKTISSLKTKKVGADHHGKYATMKMKYFNPKGTKENLFKSQYFNNYEEVYAEIMNVHDQTGKSYEDFKKLVDSVKKKSYGLIYGIGNKIPIDQSQQYKVILRIFQKMFKAELTKERVNSIIQKIDAILKQKTKEAGSSKIGVSEIVKVIMSTWTKDITEIVKERKAKDIPTVCQVSDLLRAKLMFDSVDHLKKAISAIDDICMIKGYKILELDNRLSKPQTQDVVFKIKIKAAVCQLQLAIKQEQSTYHFTHAVYQIQRSPLGSIFGSYIFMSKGFQYPIYENCQDIVHYLKDASTQQDKKTLDAAKYIVENLNAD